MQSMYKNDLPFLFKILSFDKALPLQAHPDPKLGEKLRKIEIKQQGMNSDCAQSPPRIALFLDTDILHARSCGRQRKT